MHLLQETLGPRDRATEHLYLRLVNARGDTLSTRASIREAGVGEALALPLERGDTLSTDTFFGAFYRAYWRDYTDVETLALAVDLEGEARLHVWEDTGAGVRVIRRERLRPRWRERFLLELPGVRQEARVFDADRPSRLFVTLQALRPSRLHGLDYVTETAPKREARLSIGLCTFNQEPYFARTLKRVTALLDAEPRVVRAWVVNQGKPFESEEIRALLQHPKVTGIPQRNLGGCGGFTRSLAEAMEAGESTHHLMMDDDIVLDERMIARALRFLDHAARPIALGAGMLDALRPTVMYEAGAFLSEDNRITPYCHNVDLADPGQLSHFNDPVKTDYNAWWFCTVPLEEARKVALPAPVFIRGDDFEYGQRLARAGVPTVTLPGIAVWHEPFYAKPAGWQAYYDLRNRLIFGATYPEKVRQLSLAHVTGLMTTAILTHDYRAAELRMKAVEDFLAGPEALFARDPEALHGEVMALARAHAPEVLEGEGWKRQPPSEGRRAPVSMKGLAFWQLVALLRTGLGPLRTGARPVFLDRDAHPRNTAGRAYVLTNGPRSFHLGFTPDRGRMWRLMARAARLAWRYRAGRGAASRAWAQGIARYRAPEWWARVWAQGSEVADGVRAEPPPSIARM